MNTYRRILLYVVSLLGAFVAASVAQAATITVTQVESPQYATVGQQLAFTVTANVSPVDQIRFDNPGNFPTGAILDPISQDQGSGQRLANFTFTPTAGQVGTYQNVLIKAQSGSGKDKVAATTTFTIVVNNANRPPVLDPIGNKSTNEGVELTFQVSGSDPDGDALTFSASNLPPNATFTPATRTFDWTPTYSQSGNYPNVRFIVQSGSNPIQSDYEDINITVGNVNRHPSINDPGSQTATENTPYLLTITGSDPDGNNLTFSASGLPSGASFNSLTQMLTWTPSYDQAGTYTVTFGVVDDGTPQLSASKDVTITVGNVNRPPVLDPIGNKTAYKGDLLTFTVTGSDPDGTAPPYGNTLTYTATGTPDGSNFNVTAAQTFVWIPVRGQEGAHVVTFTVADDGNPSLSDSEDVTITVVNRPPVANAGTYPEHVEQTGPTGADVVLDGSKSTDPDKDPITSYNWTWAGGSATGVNPTIHLPVGATEVTLVVSDGIDNSDPAKVTILVKDTIPPTVTAAATTDPNINGWYKGNVIVHFTCSDAGSGVASCPSDQTLSAEGSAVSSTKGVATDVAGNSAESDIVTVKIDKTAPTVTASALPAANGNGWNNTKVTVSFSGTDSLSGIDHCDAAVVLSNEGSGQSASGTCYDKAGNSALATASGINIDKTPPTVDITGVANGATYVLGAVPAAGCNTQDQDGLSGVAQPASLNVSGGNGSVGTFTATCSGGTDKAGNVAANAVASYKVQYAATGLCLGSPGHAILQPINADNSSAFKQGSTVPAKFRVCDANGHSIGTAGVISSFGLLKTVAGSITLDEAIDSTTPDTAFRWSATDQQWIFNMSTKNLKAGQTYIYQINLNDGTPINFQFGLR